MRVGPITTQAAHGVLPGATKLHEPTRPEASVAQRQVNLSVPPGHCGSRSRKVYGGTTHVVSWRRLGPGVSARVGVRRNPGTRLWDPGASR